LDQSGAGSQNYQVFNDVRARYYDECTFGEGYPAATGIGMDTGGIIIGFIAVSPSSEVTVVPIGNPRQVDAHRYSESMLLGKDTGIMKVKCTPKFERAKHVRLQKKDYFLVSGTASIVGEKSKHPGDVVGQTHTTIDNIFELFSEENQKQLGIHLDNQGIVFTHLRVYVKHLEDIPEVKKVCSERLRSASSVYLVADICREELLVEIEGIFSSH
jgi:hypothetical protein